MHIRSVTRKSAVASASIEEFLDIVSYVLGIFNALLDTFERVTGIIK